jgi:hypothetical protein
VLVAEVNQGIQSWHNLQDDIATTPAIAAVRATAINVFLAVKMDKAIPALTRAHINSCFIDEHLSYHPILESKVL